MALAAGPVLICLSAMAVGGLEAVRGRPAPLMVSWHRLWRKLPATAQDWRLHGLTLMLTGLLAFLVLSLVAVSRTDLRPPETAARPLGLGIWLAQVVVGAVLLLVSRRIRFRPLPRSRRRVSLD